MLKRSLVLMLLVCDTAIPSDAPSSEAGSRVMMMLKTEVVPGKKLRGPPEEYKSDGNPKTIELVTLRPDDGPSRVSEDGEVIFLKDSKAAADEVDVLLEKAFDIRMERQREKT